MPPLMGKTQSVTYVSGMDQEKMVGRIGFEPMTNWLKASRLYH